MTHGSLLAAGRRAAETLMVDTCRARRRTGETVDTNDVVTPTYTTLFTGRCKVQVSAGLVARDATAGEHLYSQSTLQVHLPVAADQVAVDDEIVVTASVSDPQLVGRVFRVDQLIHKSFLTARRLGCVEVQS